MWVGRWRQQQFSFWNFIAAFLTIFWTNVSNYIIHKINRPSDTYVSNDNALCALFFFHHHEESTIGVTVAWNLWGSRPATVKTPDSNSSLVVVPNLPLWARLFFLARITPPDFLSFSMLTALNSCYSIPKLSSMHMAISYIVQASNANKPPVTIWSGFHMCANESTAIPRCQILFANTSVVSSYSLTTLLEKYLLNVTGK